MPTNVPIEATYPETQVNNPDLTYPGLIFTPNDQCQQIYGDGSTFCQVKIIYKSFFEN